MTRGGKYLFHYPLIIILLTYCLEGCGNKEADTISKKQKELSSDSYENVISAHENIPVDGIPYDGQIL